MTDETRHIILKIAKKCLLLLLLLVVMDLVYRFTLYPRDRERYCSLLEFPQIPIRDTADIIYLGESSEFSCSPTDTDRRSIGTMIGDMMPDHKMGCLSKGAVHAAIYYDILRNIPRDNPVKTVIVTVNMRSFSSEWIYSNLEQPLQKEQIMMKKAPALYKRMLLAFKAYVHWSEAERSKLVRKGFRRQTFTLPHPFPYHNASEWDHAIANSFQLYNGKQVSGDTVELACHYIKCFAYQLDDKNPRIKDSDKIVRLCQRRGWRLVFNILADNMDQIKTLAGPDLEYLMQENAQYIIQRYEPMGVIVVNNQYSVREEDFFETFVTEHYNQRGRRNIAEKVAEKLNDHYSQVINH
ncbi:MAG: hypothetical protein IKQ75_08605 [Bacteroidales bacterium]|nr:hypothetical protein [Bacteroidales bacterium]